MNVIPIVSKMNHELRTENDILFHAPYPLPDKKDVLNPYEKRSQWKKKQNKSLFSFLSRK